MERILIIGSSGSGKTTLGHNLSNILGIPYYDLDDYYWLPEWKSRPSVEFKKILHDLSNEESWIIGGNYLNASDVIWDKCTTIVWLDYSLRLCFRRALFRSIARIIFREPCCNGNYESFVRTFLSQDSILLWILKSYRRRRKAYNQLYRKYFTIKTFLMFRHPEYVYKWLKVLGHED